MCHNQVRLLVGLMVMRREQLTRLVRRVLRVIMSIRWCAWTQLLALFAVWQQIRAAVKWASRRVKHEI